MNSEIDKLEKLKKSYTLALKLKRNHQYKDSFKELIKIYKHTKSYNVDQVLFRCRSILLMIKILKLAPHLISRDKFIDRYIAPIVGLLMYYNFYTYAKQIAIRSNLPIYHKDMYVLLSGWLITVD